MTDPSTADEQDGLDWKTTLLVSFVILAAGAGVTTLIFFTEPTAQRSGATRETAMLVDVKPVARATVRPTIEAMGTVRPAQDIVLSPRVSGRVLRRGEGFTPGGYVEEGDTLLQIDPSDYRNTLQQRRSELRQAKADLKLEMGRQDVAQQDYQLLGDTLSGANKALVLRTPQLKSARSAVESARAAVEQARLDLQRTTITAPFDAHILSRNVNVGSKVAPGDELGRLVGLDTYWVEATVPVSKLRWLRIPDDGTRGSPVQVRNRTAWPEGTSRTGYVHKLLGALEDQTRLARVLISVPDPHARTADDSDQPRLMIGAYVEARIQAEALENVVRLNRDYVRENETVWVMEHQKLEIRDVHVAVRDPTYAYIDEGLAEGDSVVTTNLATVRDGAPLRLEDGPPETERDTLPSPE
ncbi:MAG: efflux RND transporter periplasmic adaptor subunit [Salinibacter sp.]